MPSIISSDKRGNACDFVRQNRGTRKEVHVHVISSEKKREMKSEVYT